MAEEGLPDDPTGFQNDVIVMPEEAIAAEGDTVKTEDEDVDLHHMPPPLPPGVHVPVDPPDGEEAPPVDDAGPMDQKEPPEEVPPVAPPEAEAPELEHQESIKMEDIQAEMHASTDTNDRDTTAMIAEAAAAAVASVSGVEGGASEDATAAALAVKTDAHEKDDGEDEEVRAKRNELRRKRYREKAEEGSVASMMSDSKSIKSHEEQLAARRLKDRERYAAMTTKQRQVYNAKRRDQYHRQSEESRQKRRERERNRYHSLADDDAKERNARRAKLERERYQRLSATELESKNRKRRERAAMLRKRSKGGSIASEPSNFTANDGASLMTAVTDLSQPAALISDDKEPATSENPVAEPKPDEDGAKDHDRIKNLTAADEAVKEAVKEAVEEAVAKAQVVQI